MRLAFILGGNKQMTQNLDSRIKGMRDNIQTDYFSSLQEMINYSYQRNIVFDRVVVISTILNSPSLINDFYEYWSNSSTDTNIILVAKKGSDEELCKFFYNKFSTPLVAAMLLDSTTLQTLGEAVILHPSKLTEKYGITNHMEVEHNTGFEYKPEVPEVKEEPVKQVQTQQDTKPKKKGFFASIFGKKDVSPKPVQEEPVQSTNQVTEPVQEEQPEIQSNDYVEETSYPQEDSNTQEQMGYTNDSWEEDYTQDETPTSEENSESFDYDFTNDFESTPESVVTDSSYSEDVNFEENYNDAGFVEDYTNTEPIQEEFVEDFSANVTENNNIVSEEPSPLNTIQDEIDFSEDFSFIEESEADTPTTTPQVDEDFGNFSMSYEDKSATQNLQEVDEDLSGLKVASEENAYRDTTEKPIIVEKVVVKEVVRNISPADKSLTALNGVVLGKNKKVIIVTGDRGSGITSTAIALAKTMSQRVKVLYVDLDTTNHGLLSYINYDTFRDYQGTPLQGLKYCKSAKFFANCVVNYEHNLDILSSDYDCEVTNEEIEIAQGVVAEICDEYNLIVVDCPADKLSLISDLILLGNTILCVEESKRGFMNMLCTFENSPLSAKYKRMIVSRGNMFLTKCLAQTDTKKLLKYINAIFESDTVDWMSMDITKFNGKLSDETLNKIFEA